VSGAERIDGNRRTENVNRRNGEEENRIFSLSPLLLLIFSRSLVRPTLERSRGSPQGRNAISAENVTLAVGLGLGYKDATRRSR
jgi:hypothetical protein